MKNQSFSFSKKMLKWCALLMYIVLVIIGISVAVMKV